MQLTVEKLIYGGDGLARLRTDENGRGKAVFLPFVLKGETVNSSLIEQKPGFARGTADEILAASPHRVEPQCPYFTRCGGCHYQHSNYQHQLEIKEAILRENLRRIAKLELDVELKIHPSPEWGYRNRSRFAVRFEPEFALCYRKFNSHQLLPVEQCPISSPLINRTLEDLWHIGRAGELPEGVEEIELFANPDDTAFLMEAYCDAEISTTAFAEWARVCQSRMLALLGVGAFKDPSPGGARTTAKREIASVGKNEIKYETSKVLYRVSAGSFFQVNRFLVDQLVNVVTDGQSGDTALDLYAGVGLFSSVLNREFQRVIAVESSPTSYSDLLYNSAPNVKTVYSTTEQYLKNVRGKIEPDFVIVDPPRAGLSENVIKCLVASTASRVTYVSCDPATVARDLRGLLGAGYRVQRADLIDLFPQTLHIESVFHLAR